MKFIDIPAEERKALLNNLQLHIGLKPAIIEKDWWVTAVLRALFKLPYAHHLSFKGGTGLSKCWGLIERMSEDIDIGITREFLGFEGLLSKTQISDKLRRAACSFVREELQFDLKQQMLNNGIDSNQFSVQVDITPISTTDPEIIWVKYVSVVDTVDYIAPVVKIEVSGRSMAEPTANIEIGSMIDKAIPNALFHEPWFEVRAVLAQRTFLEKLFLLHEEFAKDNELIRVDRMSRHLYDIHRIMQTSIADEALEDDALYKTVIAHRKTFIGLKGFDYATLSKKTLSIIPPKTILPSWKKDYETMQQEMIYGETVSFEQIIHDLELLNDKINRMAE